MWLSGTNERISRRWYTSDGEVTSGTANAKFIADFSGTVKYLQGNNIFDPAPFSFPMTYTAGLGWQYFFVVPSTMLGRNITVVCTHTDANTVPAPEEHFVTVRDFDTQTTTPGATVR